MQKCKPNIQEITNFLLEYAVSMLGAGTYSSRVTRCVTRIANSYGYDTAITVFLKNITITVTDLEDYSVRRTYVRENISKGINFKIIMKLSALSWQIYDNKYDLNEAKQCYYSIISEPKNNFLYTLLLISTGNAAFCRLLGGDLGSILVIFLTTFVGFNIRTILTKIKVDIRIQYILCSFVVSYLAYLLSMAGLSHTYDMAMAASVLFLIPGPYFINAIIEILNENTLIGFSRTLNISILIACIAIGISITLSITDIGFENV